MSVQQAEPSAPTGTVSCPRCGAAADAGQLLCVECGQRIALAWRQPPSWRLPAAVVGGVVLAAGIALALALADVAGDAEQVASAPVPTAAAPAPAPVPTDSAPVPTDSAPAPPAAEEEPAPAPAPEEPSRTGGDLESWPADTSAYTVILVSSEDRAAAERRASSMADEGIPAGVLQSDDYSSLNPGYWVVFAGRFDTSEDAEKEAEKYASRGFPGGYPRFVNGGG
ncbi:MAG TPA: SPOR domain-containing protein [Thermoleophilaceae bacterium]|nr:SPOR domain-containing protein [Thermoleophilaceae bacterium]